ncbi:MAG: universal stress protein [Desulfohalobiaceae bacterium]|nr:universal stress protein [Desulfohalobiaceae bacterium]
MNYLVCFDGTQVARDALKLAIKQAKVLEAKIFLIHSMMGGPYLLRRDLETAERNLKQARLLVERENIPCKADLSIRGMEAGEDIVRYAKENNINEIVIGVKRRSRVGKMLFGSTAQFVILEAPCPVLTVR